MKFELGIEKPRRTNFPCALTVRRQLNRDFVPELRGTCFAIYNRFVPRSGIKLKSFFFRISLQLRNEANSFLCWVTPLFSFILFYFFKYSFVCWKFAHFNINFFRAKNCFMLQLVFFSFFVVFIANLMDDCLRQRKMVIL